MGDAILYVGGSLDFVGQRGALEAKRLRTAALEFTIGICCVLYLDDFCDKLFIKFSIKKIEIKAGEERFYMNECF